MRKLFQKPTLFLFVCILAIVVGIPYGIYAFTLDGGAMLGGVIMIGWVVLFSIILGIDRIAVGYVKPLILSIIELVLMSVVIYFIFK